MQPPGREKDLAMIRSLPLAVLATCALAAAPIAAKDAGPYYHAERTQPAENGRVIAGGVLWMCEGTQCFAGKGTSRPAVMCKRLAEKTSTVMSFTYGGEALAADDLARCNG
jgi:hypothetical protein